MGEREGGRRVATIRRVGVHRWWDVVGFQEPEDILSDDEEAIDRHEVLNM